jgi:hypothetical protein
MSLDNAESSYQGKRGATAAIDILLCNYSMSFTRKEITRMLERSRRLERVTNKLGISIVLICGSHLGTLLFVSF